MGKKYEEVKADADEEMIDTWTKDKPNPDVEMEEVKEPRMAPKPSIDTHSEMLKSETIEHEKSEFSEAYEIDPFFHRTTSMDVANLEKIQGRTGRSESIRNPILTSFWKLNESNGDWKRIKPDLNYMKLEERGFMRHLLLEGKYDEALQHLNDCFTDILKENLQISVAINCLKFVTILQEGDFSKAITFGEDNLNDKSSVEIPALDSKGQYWKVTPQDFFSLIAYQDMTTADNKFLLNSTQREVIADMINEIIVLKLGGQTCSQLEHKMKELNSYQHLIREERNDLGEIFQFRVPK